MNYAIVTAGGVGSRVNANCPKQFLTINDKPLIVYTLEKFQESSLIDEIVVPCLEGWQDKIKEYVIDYKLDKVKAIVMGGSSGQQSIYNGYMAIKDRCDDNTIILIHDGNRPNVSQLLIKDGIELCKKKGNAIAYIPCQEVVFLTNDFASSNKLIERKEIARTQTPHVFNKKTLEEAFDFAKKYGYNEEPAICSLLQKLGMTCYLYKGDEKNLKITFSSDLDIFKALIGM